MTAPICPECAQGKHGNCDGSSWNPAADDIDTCPCAARGHFTPDPRDEETAKVLHGMAEEAAKTDTMRCVYGEPMLFLPYGKAVIPGHIYSEAGVREARISRCCEYHFDKAFEEGWTDPLTGEPGGTPEEESE